MSLRNGIQEFGLANHIYKGATVTFYTVSGGVKTATKATLYADLTTSATLPNPQHLGATGKFVQPVYVEVEVIATISGLTIPDHDTGVIQSVLGSGSIDLPAVIHAATSITPLLDTDELPVWRTLTQLYKVTWANVKAGILALFSVSAGSSLVGFLQAGTGAVAETVQSKLREVPSLRDYGVLGDATDETTKMQAAIDAQPAGGWLACPPGDYKFTNLTISKPLTLIGAGHGSLTTPGTSNTYNGGTRFSPYGVSSGYLITVQKGAVLNNEGQMYGVSMHDIYFEGGARTSAVGGISLNNLDHSILSNIKLESFSLSALKLASVRESAFINLRTKFCGNNTVVGYDPVNNYPAINIIDDKPVGNDATNMLTFTDCGFIYSLGDSVVLDSTNSANGGVREIRFNDCSFHGLLSGVVLPGGVAITTRQKQFSHVISAASKLVLSGATFTFLGSDTPAIINRASQDGTITYPRIRINNAWLEARYDSSVATGQSIGLLLSAGQADIRDTLINNSFSAPIVSSVGTNLLIDWNSVQIGTTGVGSHNYNRLDGTVTPGGVAHQDITGKNVSQYVALTPAASGTGIAVPDSTSLAIGTSDFTIIRKVSLPDWTPAAEVPITQKTDGTTGFKLAVQAGSTGKLALSLNAVAAYVSTVAPSIVDGSLHEIAVCVSNSALTATFYVDGERLGTPVAITAYTSLTNAATSLYSLGSSTARAAGLDFGGAIFNYALSSQDVADVYQKGVGPDKIGATNATLNVSACTSTTNAYGTFSGASATGFTAADAAPANAKNASTADEIAFAIGRLYSAVCDATLTSGLAPTMSARDSQGGSHVAYTTKELTTVSQLVCAAGRNAFTFFAGSSTTGVINFNTGTSATSYAIANLLVKQAGAVALYKPEDIQLGIWYDSSGNGNNASYPSTGFSFGKSVIDNEKLAAPTAGTGSATLTIAQLLNKSITDTHASGATATYTLPTATLMDAALPSMQVGDSFTWEFINLSAAAADTVTLAAGASHTIVGNAVVQSAHATTGALYGSSGLFRTKKTAASTYVTYRRS